MKRLNWCTVVGVDEIDIDEFISEIIDAFNDYHKTGRDIPPPYLAVDIGKVVGLHNGYKDLQDENTRLRDALEKWCTWEEELLNTREAWEDGLPKMTQELYDKYIELQSIRNKALKESE
jgi:hypothetical protein